MAFFTPIEKLWESRAFSFLSPSAASKPLALPRPTLVGFVSSSNLEWIQHLIKKKGGEGVERGKGLSCQSVEEEGARRICKFGGGGRVSLGRQVCFFRKGEENSS